MNGSGNNQQNEGPDQYGHSRFGDKEFGTRPGYKADV